MAERWLGLVVSSSETVVAVDCSFTGSDNLELIGDFTWKLQKGNRPAAYSVIYDLITDYIQEHNICCVAIKESAVSVQGTTKGHLESAELRGIILAASAKYSQVQTFSKSVLSRNFGERKVDDYIKDEEFWNEKIDGSFRKGSREAALLLLATQATRL